MKIGVLGIRGIPANYGGFETCAEETTKRWAKRGNDVYVYCRKHWYTKRLKSFNDVNLIYTSSLKSKSLDTFSHTILSFIYLLVSKNEIDTIHLYNTGNGILVPIIKLFRKKVIISVDGLEWKRAKWGFWGKSMHKIGELFAATFSDIIVADNEEVIIYYKEKFKWSRVVLIKYGAKIIDKDPLSYFLSQNNLQSKKYYIFVGRLVPEKGVHNLIESFKKLKTDYPLVIIGDDHVESHYKQGLLSQKSDKIRFLGFRYNEEYEQLLANALMYVSASSLEGTSPSLLAAMGAGVCSLVNGINENLYTIGDSAISFKPNDFDNLTTVWQNLVDNPEAVEKMALKGKRHIGKNFSWDIIAEQYLRIFN